MFLCPAHIVFSGLGLLVMIFRAFFAGSAPLRRLSPLQKQKTRYLCNFFAITDSSLLLQTRKQPFLLHFRAAIRVLAPRDNPQSQKSCNPSRFFVFELLEQSRDSTGGCCGPGVGLGGSGAGVVNPAQAQGGAVERREALRVRVFARALCCVIAFP